MEVSWRNFSRFLFAPLKHDRAPWLMPSRNFAMCDPVMSCELISYDSVSLPTVYNDCFYLLETQLKGNIIWPVFTFKLVAQNLETIWQAEAERRWVQSWLYRGHFPPCSFTLYLPLKGVLIPRHTHTDTQSFRSDAQMDGKHFHLQGLKTFFQKAVFLFPSSGWRIGRILIESNPCYYSLSLKALILR